MKDYLSGAKVGDSEIKAIGRTVLDGVRAGVCYDQNKIMTVLTMVVSTQIVVLAEERGMSVDVVRAIFDDALDSTIANAINIVRDNPS